MWRPVSYRKGARCEVIDMYAGCAGIGEISDLLRPAKQSAGRVEAGLLVRWRHKLLAGRAVRWDMKRY